MTSRFVDHRGDGLPIGRRLPTETEDARSSRLRLMGRLKLLSGRWHVALCRSCNETEDKPGDCCRWSPCDAYGRPDPYDNHRGGEA